MKTLIITRHGKASEALESQPDILRALSTRGLKDIKVIGRELSKKNLIPGLILSSPAIRSVETARHLAGCLDISKSLVLTRDSLYGNFSNEIFSFMETTCPSEKIVMVVGHNPFLLLMIEYLSGVILESFPTLATLVLDFDIEGWGELTEKKGTMRKLFVPSELR